MTKGADMTATASPVREFQRHRALRNSPTRVTLKTARAREVLALVKQAELRHNGGKAFRYDDELMVALADVLADDACAFDAEAVTS
jgi:hypothetical protein